MHQYRSRLAVAAAAILLATAALAGDNVIKPWRVQRNIKPVIESTLDVYPQIQTTFQFREREAAENLPPPIPLGIGGDNSLPIGGIGEFTRGSIDRMFPGMGATGWVPPDPNAGIGPNNIVQVVNCSVAFFNKATGQKTFQQVINGSGGFFGSVGATDFVYDTKAFFDPVSQRFFILALELKDDANNKIAKLCIGVSDNSDPAGTWYKYRIEARLDVGTNKYWIDYPSYGGNKDALAVSGNMFAMSGSSGWGGIQFIVMKKAPMLSGQATTAYSLRDPNGASGQVSQSIDPSVDVIYGASVNTTNSLKIYAMQNLTGTPTISTATTTIPSFTPLARDAISTNGRTFWTVDSRLFNLVYRNGRLYTTHHVSYSGTDSRNTPRWYEINTNGWPNGSPPTLRQSGVIATGVGEDNFFPAINANKQGDISLVFTRSSTSITADMMMTSRRSSDPFGQMGIPVKLVGSSNPNYGGSGSNRWGDFFSVQIDPDDDAKFWGISMVGDSVGNWQTHMLSWDVSPPVYSKYDATSVSPFAGQYLNGTLADILLSDNLYYSIKSTASPIGYAAGIETRFTLDKPADKLRLLQLEVESQAVSGSTGMAWLWNWNTSDWEFIKAFPVTASDTTLDFVASGDLTRFVSPGGEVRAVFRVHTPNRPTGGISAWTLKTDLCQLQADWKP